MNPPGRGRPLAGTVTKAQIKSFALDKARRGELFDRSKDSQLDRFLGSCDRFAEIATASKAEASLGCGVGGRHPALAFGRVRSRVPCGRHHRRSGRLSRSLPEEEHPVFALQCRGRAAALPRGQLRCHCLLPMPGALYHSHLPALREFYRVLRPGGLLEIDVPNAAAFATARACCGEKTSPTTTKSIISTPSPFSTRGFISNPPSPQSRIHPGGIGAAVSPRRLWPG